MQATAYKYNLDRTSRKFNCPQCGKRRFVRVVDNETGQYLPDHVGRCDRESNCTYEYTWAQWLKDTGTGREFKVEPKIVEAPKPFEYLPFIYLERTLQKFNQNNLFLFMCTLFKKHVAVEVFKKYLIGTSSYWKGASVYWQIDEQEGVRQCKIMLYNSQTGKRIKEGFEIEQLDRKTGMYKTIIADRPCSMVFGRFINKTTKEMNLQQTFFGAHLLKEYPTRKVCIVESEKTAIIASIYLPQFNWLATGGASGCRWTEYEIYKVLKGRTVTFFPDYGMFKRDKTCYEEWCDRVKRINTVLNGNIRVSDVLEKRLQGLERKDQDLADLLLIKDKSTGLALTEDDYPVMWDYKY